MEKVISSKLLQEALRNSFHETLDAENIKLSQEFVDNAFSGSGLMYDFDKEEGIITINVYPGCKMHCVMTDVTYYELARPREEPHYLFQLLLSMYHDYSHVDNYTAPGDNFNGIFFPVSALPSMIVFFKELAMRIISKKEVFNIQSQSALENKSISKLVKAEIRRNGIDNIVVKIAKNQTKDLLVIKNVFPKFNLVAHMDVVNFKDRTANFIEIYRSLPLVHTDKNIDEIITRAIVSRHESIDTFSYKGYGKIGLIADFYSEKTYPINNNERIDYGKGFTTAIMVKSHPYCPELEALCVNLEKLGYNYGVISVSTKINQGETLPESEAFLIQMSDKCFIRIVANESSNAKKFGIQVLLRAGDVYLANAHYIEEVENLSEIIDLFNVYCRYVSPQRLDKLAKSLNRENAGIEQILQNVENQFCLNAELTALRDLLPQAYAIERGTEVLVLFFDKTVNPNPIWNVVQLNLKQDNTKTVALRISNIKWIADNVGLLQRFCQLSSEAEGIEIIPLD